MVRRFPRVDSCISISKRNLPLEKQRQKHTHNLMDTMTMSSSLSRRPSSMPSMTTTAVTNNKNKNNNKKKTMRKHALVVVALSCGIVDVVVNNNNNNKGVLVVAAERRTPPPPPPPPPSSSQYRPPPPPRREQQWSHHPNDENYDENTDEQHEHQQLYDGYGDDTVDEQQQQNNYWGQPPPPPPPSSTTYGDENNYGYDYENTYGGASTTPQSSSSSSSSSTPKVPQLPIHYEFQSKNADVDGQPHQQRGRRRRTNTTDGADADADADDYRPETSASARRDLVTRYWSTKLGKLQIMSTTALLGTALGTFLSKSFIPVGGDGLWATVFGVFLWLSTLFRTPLGELSRALGLSLLLVLQRTTRIRRDYPTWMYIPPALGLGRTRGLRPFPPTRNPWRYVPRSDRDPDFNMMYAIAAMAFVGSACGGNLPFIPSWIGALSGAGLFGLACTWTSPRGDLARTCGMRVVSTAGQLWEIQADLQIIPKATVVSSQIIDRAMILDRKHRVKDKFLSFASKGYEQATKVAAQIQQQQRGGNNIDDRDNDRDRRDRRQRPGGDRDDDRDGRGRGPDRRRSEDLRDRGRTGDRNDYKQDFRRPERPPRDEDDRQGSRRREYDNKNDDDRGGGDFSDRPNERSYGRYNEKSNNPDYDDGINDIDPPTKPRGRFWGR